MKKILVVDDDAHIREVISFALRKALFQAVEAEDGAIALNMFELESPDMIILDIGMPEIDGTDVCKLLRQKSSVPIIFVSAKDSEFDRVLCLELGGDDYLTKPFSPRELVARVKAIFRRTVLTKAAENALRETMLTHEKLALNVETHIVFWDEQPIDFTSTEFEIIKTMLKHPGRVFSRDALMDGAYPNNVSVSDRTIDSHLRRIRARFKKLDAFPIETVHGVGYKINDCLS
jgi:two-component system, OmpR family, response regulator